MRSGMHIRHITLHCSMPRFRADYGPGQEIVHALMDKLVCCTAFLIAKSLALSARQIQAQGRSFCGSIKSMRACHLCTGARKPAPLSPVYLEACEASGARGADLAARWPGGAR